MRQMSVLKEFNHRITAYPAKLRTYIRECEKIITLQKAAAARLGGDGGEAGLTQKLLRWLEHMHATQVAELARVEKIKTKRSRSAVYGDPGPPRGHANAPDTDAAETRVFTRRPAAGSAMIDRARQIFDFP